MKNRALTNILSQKEINIFNETGYLTLNVGLSPSTLCAASTDMKVALELGDKHRKAGTRVQDAWKTSRAIREIACDDKLLSCLHQLFGRKPKPFQTLNFPVGTQQRLHSDTIHFNSIPSGFMAGIWVALEDVTMDNGPLIYYPGSHKMPEYNMQDFGLNIGYENYKHYETMIESKIAESGIAPSYGVMKKGQALIWHANLIHGGAKTNDPSSTRYSQVTHYYFGDCKYFTPMTSTKDDVDWRHPEWIGEPRTEIDSLYSVARRMAGKARRKILSYMR